MIDTVDDGSDLEFGRIVSAAGSTFEADARTSGIGSVACRMRACVVGGTTDIGGCAPTNHMTKTPATAPPPNEVSFVLGASRRMSGTRLIHAGIRMASTERARRRFMRIASDANTVSARRSDGCERVRRRIAARKSAVENWENWMRIGDGATSYLRAGTAIDASGLAIGCGLVSETNSDRESSLSRVALEVVFRPLVEPERWSQESGRLVKGIVVPPLVEIRNRSYFYAYAAACQGTKASHSDVFSAAIGTLAHQRRPSQLLLALIPEDFLHAFHRCVG